MTVETAKTPKTEYLLSMYQPVGPIPPPEVLEPIMAELGVLRDELRAAGQWVFGNGLTAPASATVLRADGGEVLVTDGPFAEGKEYLGGVTIFTAADLDEALGWARRYARAAPGLTLELRPFQDGR